MGKKFTFGGRKAAKAKLIDSDFTLPPNYTTKDLFALQHFHDNYCKRVTEQFIRSLDAPRLQSVKEGKPTVKIEVDTVVYHGTASMEGIFTERAILPRGDRKPTHAHIPSKPEFVYLTNCYAFGFATQAMAEREADEMAILEIELEPLLPNLRPDEDSMVAANVPIDLASLTNPQLWFWNSLYRFGTVAHLGPIPLEQVTRIVRIPNFDENALAIFAADHGTEFSHGAVRIQQKALLSWLFNGGEFPLKPSTVVFPELLGKLDFKNVYPHLVSAGLRDDTLLRAHLMTHAELWAELTSDKGITRYIIPRPGSELAKSTQ